jgi:hypothetical protein
LPVISAARVGLHTVQAAYPRVKTAPRAARRSMFELYDLTEDPYEMNNLAGTNAVKKIEQDLKGRLSAWMIHHRDFVPLPIGGGGGSARSQEKGAEE